MSDVERRFHETWLGMVQPVEGLLVSVPVLVDAQCMERQPPHVQQKLVELCPPSRTGDAGSEGYRIEDVGVIFTELLGFARDAFDGEAELPDELSLFVPEGKQTLRPTMALRKMDPPSSDGGDATPAGKAGARYEMLVSDLGAIAEGVGLDLDRPETVTGTWDYPPAAKFDRLLRHCRVPIGLLTNREVLRLVYAPHGESSGSITFRLDDMASVGGRPILDAFVMLLAANRFFGVTAERTLPAILAESRKRQANVTNDLAEQVFDALQILLRGFEAAAERDGAQLITDALEREGDHLYKGLLTVLLRLVFVLYAEDRGLLPVEHPSYAKSLSALALFDELQSDQGAYPDSMARRFGAWGRLVTLFRAIFLGLSHGDLSMPPRRGSLFNPHEYPFLEGWGPGGSAPITQPEDRAAVQLPSVDDETIFRVLEKLLMFEGQRLSYRALDVEQIGSVYEALMGYHVVRTEAAAVCMRPDRLWVTGEEVLAVPAARRAKWIKETVGLSAAQAQKLAEELMEAEGRDAALEALAKFSAGGKGERELARAKLGQLVLQPGTERRRTSSHYTPRSLSAPIVRRTIEPLLAVMGNTPSSEQVLHLKVCDPAMGSGAFLVEACRFLADHVLAAWTRESAMEEIATEHGDPLLHARRLVAQRCLYGVDKNQAAVELAKLSLWLVTLSKTLPFTFLDHALRHGDSLVGLDFDQLRAFHWKRPKEKKEASKQLDLFGREIAVALDEAIALRQKIGSLGDAPVDDREKERLLWDSQDALDRVRLIGDVVVGAFFAHRKDKDREKERVRREVLVRAWLGAGGSPSEELREMQRSIRTRLPVFHWMAEFPEVFYAERPDPLDSEQVNQAAHMDAFVGNPPFAGKNALSVASGSEYLEWLQELHTGAHGNADVCAHFFRRCDSLLGKHGTMGLIATDTIAEGDTRSTGLKVLVDCGGRIYSASRRMLWAGGANVSISVVHIAKGNAAGAAGSSVLDGTRVGTINSQLTVKNERADPSKLASNTDGAFVGSYVLGMGFALTPEERGLLVKTSPRNADRIFPYLGAQEVNTSPAQTFNRYVIDFGQMTLDQAENWPDLIRIVRERVKPERDKNNRVNYRQNWWLFGEGRPGLYAALAPLKRCLVTAITSKHRTFTFIPSGIVLDQGLIAFPVEGCSPFSVLQSRIHEVWTRQLSSSYGSSSTSGRILRYIASECFQTFPFPDANPAASLHALETIGQRLFDSRAKYMIDEGIGLTIAYNRIKDPVCAEPRILELRALHEEMDRAVLSAYAAHDPDGRWPQIDVPPYCPLTDDERNAVEAFEGIVVDRLFALNSKRAEAERLRGLAAGGTTQKSMAATPPSMHPRSEPLTAKKRVSRAKKQPAGQLPMPTRGCP